MTIINKDDWNEVSIKLDNHEVSLLLQSLSSEVRKARETLPRMKKALKSHPDMVMTEACLNVANDKVKLHNELLAAYISDYEQLKLEPIKLD